IEKVLAANQHLPPGQVNLITLERLQELLGDRWAELEEKVHQTAERIIRRQTGESDIFARYSATEYLVMFSGLSAKAAQLRCMEIAEAIYSFYLGEVPADAVSIKSGVARGAEGLAFVEYSQHHLLETHRR